MAEVALMLRQWATVWTSFHGTIVLAVGEAPVPWWDDTGARVGMFRVEGLNTIWVYEYTEKFGVIGYRNQGVSSYG
jgi:hypothetical protein